MLNRSVSTSWPPDTRTLAQRVKTGFLVLPMVERGCDDHEIEGAIGERQPFRDASQDRHPRIGRVSVRYGDHLSGGVDADEGNSIRKALGKLPEKVARPTPNVENSARRNGALDGQLCGAVGDLMVEVSQPSFVVARCPLLERQDIAVLGHTACSHHGCIFLIA